MTRNIISLCVFPLCCTLFLLGCHHRSSIENTRVAVKGTVTLDGKPLTGGSILFVLADNNKMMVRTMIQPDGTFSVADAPQGKAIVSVDTEICRMGNPAAYMPIPAKYRNMKTSGLIVEIGKKDGDQEIPIELKTCQK